MVFLCLPDLVPEPAVRFNMKKLLLFLILAWAVPAYGEMLWVIDEDGQMKSYQAYENNDRSLRIVDDDGQAYRGHRKNKTVWVTDKDGNYRRLMENDSRTRRWD